MLWGVAVAFDHTRRVDLSVTAFIATEVLVGVGVPALLFVSGALLTVVLDFITIGERLTQNLHQKPAFWLPYCWAEEVNIDF